MPKARLFLSVPSIVQQDRCLLWQPYCTMPVNVHASHAPAQPECAGFSLSAFDSSPCLTAVCFLGLCLFVQQLRQGWTPLSTTVRTSLHAGAPHTPVKSGSKAPAPLPEAVKEQEAEREARETEGLQRELARAEAALAALRTEHEDLVAVRAQLKRSVHRLEVRRPGVLLLAGYRGRVRLSLQVKALAESVLAEKGLHW